MIKKTAIALIALGGAATSVQASTTSITLYGVIDTVLEYNKSSGHKGNWGMKGDEAAYQGRYGSRIGFKGSEDLGDGVSLIFQEEMRFNSSNGNFSGQIGGKSRLFDGESYLGLRSKKLGTLKFGRLFNISVDLTNMDAFGGNGYAGTSYAFNTYHWAYGRLDNSIKYESPDFNGYSMRLQYSFDYDTLGYPNDDSTSPSGKNRYFGVGGSYAKGPLYAAFSYEQVLPSKSDTYSYLRKGSGLILSGSYDFGTATLYGGWVHTFKGGLFQDDYNPSAFTKENLKTPSGSGNDYSIGVSVPMTEVSTLYTQYTYSKFSHLKATQNFGLGADYKLSARSVLHGSVGYVHNSYSNPNSYNLVPNWNKAPYSSVTFTHL